MEIANTFLKRLMGLMFRPDFDDILLIVLPRKERAGIHTMFMRFPIDVYFLDEGWNLVDKKLGVKPWRATLPRKAAKYVIELKSGRELDLRKIKDEAIKLGIK